jgi:hypothetical protein
LLAAVVQQRICTAGDLAGELPFVGRVRHKRHMRLVIADIAGGAEALSDGRTSADEARCDQAEVARDLRAIGVPALRCQRLLPL